VRVDGLAAGPDLRSWRFCSSSKTIVASEAASGSRSDAAATASRTSSVRSASGAPATIVAWSSASPSPSSASLNRTTVMLSRPPFSFAARTRSSAACFSDERARRVAARSSSGTIVVSPSEQIMYTSPERAG
jgi:hypothetical protein